MKAAIKRPISRGVENLIFDISFLVYTSPGYLSLCAVKAGLFVNTLGFSVTCLQVHVNTICSHILEAKNTVVSENML